MDWFCNGCADRLTLGHVRDFSAACGQHDFGYRNLRLHAATRTAAARYRMVRVFGGLYFAGR